MVVSGQGPAMYAENFYWQWVCTHCPNGAQSARVWTVQQPTDWPGGRGVGRPLGLPRVRDVLPGWGGLDRITKALEMTGRAACCPLRVCQPTAPNGVRILRGRSLPGRAQNYDMIKAATTGANGVGP